MSTTDRMDELDSSREGTDRVGGTVILGNAVDSGPVEIIAAAAMGMGAESDAESVMNMQASIMINSVNGSFGIWAVDLLAETIAALTGDGAAIASDPYSMAAAGALTWGADGMLLNIQVFTSTGAYTPTSGTAQIVVVALGGGGGGGAAAACGGTERAVGGGGGAGALAMARITSGFSGATVTVGAGGAGGTVGNVGGTGGTSSFGSVLNAGGGGGASYGAASSSPAIATSNGAGGSASGSASLFGANGSAGHNGWAINVIAVSGRGAASPYGSGGAERISGGGTQAGDNAPVYGSGGSGAVNNATGSNQNGGNGSQGLVIIYEYNA